MKIVKLSSTNVKRLSVVEITPDGALVTIGGKNGAGKSSVLDSIAYVLGGEKLVPANPIRTGEAEARIVIDLGDYLVTRRFYRSVTRDMLPNGADTEGNETFKIGDKVTYGETKSTLVVTNKEGAKYPAPQVLLDKLYGKLTFDPLAFSREKEATQNDILRRLVGLDFTDMNTERKGHVDARTMAKRTQAQQEAKLLQMPHHTDAGEEVSVDAVLKDIDHGRELQLAAELKLRELGEQVESFKILERARENHLAEIESLEQKLSHVRGLLTNCEDLMGKRKDAVTQAQRAYDIAKDSVPEFTTLHRRLQELEGNNKKARENKAHQEQAKAVTDTMKLVMGHTKTIEEIDANKQTALQRAKFPVPGLSLSEEGVTFEGLPLSEVSASVQLRVSVAIGLALNPTLKVLLIRNGNLLDKDSMKLVAEQAEQAGAQVWMEYVTDTGEGVSVMLEDGHVAD